MNNLQKKILKISVYLGFILFISFFGSCFLFDKTAPGEVVSVTYTTSYGQITIKWTNPTDTDFDNIQIWYGTDGVADTQFTGTIDPAGTVISGLTNGIEYTITIKTVDEYSNISLGYTFKITIDVTAPGEISSITVSTSPGQMTLSWTNPSDADFDHVEIWYGTGGSANTQFTGTINPTGTTISGLTNNMVYTVSIKTVDGDGNISAGYTFTVTIDATPPGEVSDLAIATASGQLTLSWTNPSDSDFDHVDIWYGTEGTAETHFSGTIDPAGTIISGLTNGSTYTIVIKTADGNGNISTGISIDQLLVFLLGGTLQGKSLELTTAVTTIAGVAGEVGSADGTGTASRFAYPCGITTDGTYLYITDYGAHVIRKMEISSGVVTTIAGSAGQAGSADGAGLDARFNQPYEITTDGTNLYIVDGGNNTIRKMDIASNTVTTIAGSAGQTGSTDGIGTASRFTSLFGITMNGSYLYLNDNCTVRKIDITTNTVSTIAGAAGISGTTDGVGTAARFWFLSGITTDGTNLFIVDWGAHMIRKMVIDTLNVTTIAGTGSPGFDDGEGLSASFVNPYGVTTDGTNLYVADWNNCIIRKVVLATNVVSTLAGTAQVIGSADGVGSEATFQGPISITTDGNDLFITDIYNSIIRKME